MTLARKKDFTTDDAAMLREELRRAWESLVDELARTKAGAEPAWVVTTVGDGQTARAKASGVYAGVTFTVYTPGSPTPGDRFRIVLPASGSVSVLSDDGSLINGNASDSLGGGAIGWFEYQWVESPSAVGGWWRQG